MTHPLPRVVLTRWQSRLITIMETRPLLIGGEWRASAATREARRFAGEVVPLDGQATGAGWTERFPRGVAFGGVIVNDSPAFRVDNMPYGGVKLSGAGREGIRYVMEEMTEPRLIVLSDE